jgi:asparagine synthase (glutamine-hydrolysing)
MADAQGAHLLAYNGEIYNYRSLREDLIARGWNFRWAGDTEAVLASLALGGVEACEKFDGMWACAWYDEKAHRLTLLRDRLGQKPLWYAQVGKSLLFASEAKALLAGLGDVQVDWGFVKIYCTMGYVPAEWSPWAGVHKLAPAGVLQADAGGVRIDRFWSLGDAVGQARPDPASLRDMLAEATRARLVADVPVGVLLSGGIDSAVTAFLAGRAGGRVRTFSVGFEEAGYDERPLAAATARLLGTEHTELMVDPPSPETIERIVDHFDEPFADSSAIPTWLLCRSVREHVTVALTGDGGDEAFGGYDRYRAMHLGESMRPWQYMLTRIAGALLGPMAPRGQRRKLRRFVRFASGLSGPPAMQYFSYRSLFGAEELPRLLHRDLVESQEADPVEWFCDLYAGLEGGDAFQAAQMHDIATYLPGDLLVKADMASMAHGLELRSAFLDHRVMAAGIGLALEEKLSRGRGKAILRRLFGCDLPSEVVEGSKRGFGVPLARWLRGPLRQMVEEVILDRSFLSAGVVLPEAVVGLWNDHISGRRDYEHRIWMLFVLGRWMARWG